MMSNLVGAYARLDVDLVRGQGIYAFDANDNQYIDFCSGIAVNCLGHAHPELVDALTTQAQKLWQTSNVFSSSSAEHLAGIICKHSFGEKVFFCNSGAEAMEGLIKTIRRYFYAQNKPNKNRIITFNGAFHGRTIGTISAAGKGTEGFEPLLGGFDRAVYNDLESVKSAITENTAGIILEPIQGEGGVIPATTEFMQGLRALCDEHDILLGVDEIQAGIGRTGYAFAYENYGIKPDIMAIAKGLGGGFPIGAFVTTAKIAEPMVPGTHGSTFGGNPLAIAVATRVLEIVFQDKFLETVRHTGDYFGTQLAKFDNIFSVRRRGLFIGLALNEDLDNAKIHQDFVKEGLLTVKGAGNSIRLLPPLIVTPEQVDETVAIIGRVLGK